MLILKTLSIESMHGYGIAQHIQMLSADVLTIEEGSLYPALQRMLVKGWVLGRVEDFGEQPACALLQAHRRREEAARGRGVAVHPDIRRNHARDEDDVVSDSQEGPWVPCSDVCSSSSGEQFDRDLEDELRFHEEMKAHALADADGMSGDEARAAARRRIGNPLRMRNSRANRGSSPRSKRSRRTCVTRCD